MRIWQYALLLLLLVAIPTGVVFAGHIADGINRIPILVTTTTGVDTSRVQVPFVLSSQTLVDRAYVDANALDTDVQEATHVAFMPGTGQVQMLACFNNASGNETAACNNATTDDITLPATGSQVFEFAADNQFSRQWVNVSTAAVATWTVQWQYYNGSSYVALSNVSDGTSGFTTAGLNRVTWDFPAATRWPQSTLHSISGYWVRAEVTAVTSVTSAPQGQQAWYETGRWWTFAESIGAAEQKRFDLHMATGAPRTFHHYFPHSDGITTADEAGLELGTNEWEIEVKGYIDATVPTPGTTKKIVFKSGAVEVTVADAGIIQVQIQVQIAGP